MSEKINLGQGCGYDRLVKEHPEIFGKKSVTKTREYNLNQIRAIELEQKHRYTEAEFASIMAHKEKARRYRENPTIDLLKELLCEHIPTYMIKMCEDALDYIDSIDTITYTIGKADYDLPYPQVLDSHMPTTIWLDTKCRNNLRYKILGTIYILFKNLRRTKDNKYYVFSEGNNLSLVGKRSQYQKSTYELCIAILRQIGILTETSNPGLYIGTGNKYNRSTQYFVSKDIIKKYVNKYHGFTTINYGENRIIDIVSGMRHVIAEAEKDQWTLNMIATTCTSYCSLNDYIEALENYQHAIDENSEENTYQYQLVKAINEKDIAKIAKYIISPKCGRCYNRVAMMKRDYRYNMFDVYGYPLFEIDTCNSVMVMTSIALAISKISIRSEFKNPEFDPAYNSKLADLEYSYNYALDNYNKWSKQFDANGNYQVNDYKLYAEATRFRKLQYVNVYGEPGTVHEHEIIRQDRVYNCTIQECYDEKLSNAKNYLERCRTELEEYRNSKTQYRTAYHSYDADYLIKGFRRDANAGNMYYELAKRGGVVNSLTEWTKDVRDSVKKCIMYIVNSQRQFNVMKHNIGSSILMKLIYGISTYHHGRVLELLNAAKDKFKENLPRLILKVESTIMRKIWSKLKYFIPIHDSIKVPLNHVAETLDAINSVVKEIPGFNPSWSIEYNFSNLKVA